MTECYRCGQEGHRRAQCPRTAPLPPAAPPAPQGAADTRLADVIPLRPPLVPDPGLARTWADVIRQTLGWGPPEERTHGSHQ